MASKALIAALVVGVLTTAGLAFVIGAADSDGIAVGELGGISDLGGEQYRIEGIAAGELGNIGDLGGGSQIRIRGVGTITGADPLYVVDGIIVQSIKDINPEDIKSIDILKDASQTAIYGAEAANGVVIITTKHAAPAEESTTPYFLVAGLLCLVAISGAFIIKRH